MDSKILLAAQKQEHSCCCNEFCLCRYANLKQFLYSIVMGKDTMVLYCGPLSKRLSMERRAPGEKR